MPENTARVGLPLPPEETRWKPGQSGNPGGRPKGIKAFREKFRERMDAYLEALDGLASNPGRNQLEALRLLFSYGLGPPAALSPTEESELEKLTLEELRERARVVLKVAK